MQLAPGKTQGLMHFIAGAPPQVHSGLVVVAGWAEANALFVLNQVGVGGSCTQGYFPFLVSIVGPPNGIPIHGVVSLVGSVVSVEKLGMNEYYYIDGCDMTP